MTGQINTSLSHQREAIFIGGSKAFNGGIACDIFHEQKTIAFRAIGLAVINQLNKIHCSESLLE
jgi:hypothetical protein